jgi:hypothetical protein
MPTCSPISASSVTYGASRTRDPPHRERDDSILLSGLESQVAGFAYFSIGNHTKAIEIVHRPDNRTRGLLRVLVAAHLMLGQGAGRGGGGGEIKLEPWFTISALRRDFPALGEPYFATLRKAGLPE